MAANYQVRNLTVDEVFAEFRIFFIENGDLDRKDALRIHIDQSLMEFLAMIPGDVPWQEDFLLHFGLVLPFEWWEIWSAPHGTVRDLCEDLASRIEVPVSEPVTILGRRCETAGMFLTIKDVLSQHGADVSGLAPSTPIKMFASAQGLILARIRLGRVGRIPPPDYHSPIANVGCWFSFASGLALSVATYANDALTGTHALLLGLAPFALFLVLTYFGFGSRREVRFPGIVTFRDFIHAAFEMTSRKKA